MVNPASLGPAAIAMGGLLVAAAVSDAGSRRIPNGIVGTLAALGVGRAAASGGFEGAGEAMAALLVTLALAFLLFSRGLVGGGDAKLLAACAACVGMAGIPRLFLFVALGGGLLSMHAYARAPREVRREVRANLAAIATGAGESAAPPSRRRPREGVPYGVAIAMAAALVLMTGG